MCSVFREPTIRAPATRDTRATRVFNTGFSAVGNRDGWNPIFRDERTYSLSTNLTKVKGRHDIRGGYLMNFFYLDHWQPETGNPRGQFDFNGAVTALNATGAQTNNFYNQYAAFLMGSTQPSKSVQNELMTAREWQHTLYLRDRWNRTRQAHARPRHTLGALPDHAPCRRAWRRSARPEHAGCSSSPDAAEPQTNGMRPAWNNFAPRLGGDLPAQ